MPSVRGGPSSRGNSADDASLCGEDDDEQGHDAESKTPAAKKRLNDFYAGIKAGPAFLATRWQELKEKSRKDIGRQEFVQDVVDSFRGHTWDTIYMERQRCIILSREASLEKEWICYTEFMKIKGPILGAALIANKSYPMRIHSKLPKNRQAPHPHCLEISRRRRRKRRGLTARYVCRSLRKITTWTA